MQTDIIRMAREAGFPTTSYLSGRHDIAGQSVARFARFAALVAAAEREACAKVCDTLPMYGPNEETADWYGFALVDCAAAIRARGDK